MSNLHFNRTEMHKNHEELRRFYDEILRDFMERLHTEFRYKPKGNLTEQSIDKLERVTKEILRNPKRIFERCVISKEYIGCYEDELAKTENKSGPFEDKVHLKIEEKKNAEELSEDPPKKIIEVDPDEDLLHFGPTNDPENEEVPFVEEAKLPIIKEENHSDDELKLEVKKQENDRSQSSDDRSAEKDKECTMQAQRQLSTLIVGTFLASAIKRRPKQEKTTIELQNVFIKQYDQESELYYSKLVCEVTKIEKEDIRDRRNRSL